MRRSSRHLRWLPGLVAGALLVVSCNDPVRQSTPDPEPVAFLVVMSAFTPELTRLLARAQIEETTVIDGARFHIGTLAGNRVILVLSGIGLGRAAATTRTLLNAFDVSGIVFSGIAGGVNPGLSIGDVTIPAKWGQANGRLQPEDEGFWVAADPTMRGIAIETSQATLLDDCTDRGACLDDPPKIVIGGNGVSNSFFVNDADYREWLWLTFQADAVDMETSAVARVAHERAVPYIAFRSLSDLAGGGPGANEIDTFFQLAADNAAAVVLAFLEGWSARQ